MDLYQQERLVKEQIQQTNQELEKELGMELNKKVWDLVNTLIIKVNQYYQIQYNINEDTLTKVYAKSKNSNKQHIRKENK